ncbi:MAG TPA: hypothetical protein VFL34_11090 [Candidatus Sulfotelmatobacter sp.]|nr:hypothetical protein [Candidatus Sulfotelmatobacter sp.]
MKKWMVLPCILLLAAALAAQTDSSAPADNTPAEQSAPALNITEAPLPAPSAPAIAGSVPAGTTLMVRLDTTLATFSNRVGDPFQAKVTQAIVVNGATVIPVGATVEGRVTKVNEPRRISGRPTIGILPEAVILPSGERFFLDATLTDTNLRGTDVNQEGQFKGTTRDRRDNLEAGGGAAGGMLIGGLIGGGPGVLIGGAIGAGSATAHWLATHRSAILPSGTQLTLELNRPLTMGATTASGGSK